MLGYERFDVFDSPFGELCATVDARGALTSLRFGGPPPGAVRDEQGLADVRRQLAEYFAGKRRRFELELAPRGTPFQLRVWSALREIGFGEVESYRGLAARVGQPNATRAVGRANGANPIPIVIPCHRVIASDGSLGGYSGGLTIKAGLLSIEGHRYVI